MATRVSWLGIGALAILTASGCSVYRIADANGGVRGIPFYIRTAECRQSTVYQEDVRRVTVSVIGITPGAAGAAPTERVLHTRSKLARGSTIDTAADLRRRVQRLTSFSQVDTLFDAFHELALHDPNEWRANGDLTLASNGNNMQSLVDYSKPFYFNGTRPAIGSASVSTEIGPDGTLAKASAETEDKTLETLLALIPVSEYLSSKLIPTDADPAALIAGEPRLYRAEFKSEPLPVLHTLSRTTQLPQLAQPCAHADPILPTTTEGVTYARTAGGTPVAKADAPSNTVGITGQIVLPPPKK